MPTSHPAIQALRHRKARERAVRTVRTALTDLANTVNDAINTIHPDEQIRRANMEDFEQRVEDLTRFYDMHVVIKEC
jgi:hypothetical protein